MSVCPLVFSHTTIIWQTVMISILQTATLWWGHQLTWGTKWSIAVETSLMQSHRYLPRRWKRCVAHRTQPNRWPSATAKVVTRALLWIPPQTWQHLRISPSLQSCLTICTTQLHSRSDHQDMVAASEAGGKLTGQPQTPSTSRIQI